MRRAARGKSFLAGLAQRRREPGNCSRCGRPNPQPVRRGSLHGKCPACREYQRQYKAARRPAAPPKPVATVVVDPARFYHFEERVRRLEALVRDMRRFAQRRYAVGYARGQYRERCRWRDMPRDWDSFRQQIGVEAMKQMSARFDEACNG